MHIPTASQDEEAKAAVKDWTFELPDTSALPINPVPFDATSKVPTRNGALEVNPCTPHIHH